MLLVRNFNFVSNEIFYTKYL